MTRAARKFLITLGVALFFGLSSDDRSAIYAAAGLDAGPHGGTLAETKNHQFEVVFSNDGLKVYPFATDGKPLDAAKLSATATFYHPNSPKPWFDRPLQPAPASRGQASAALEAGIGLSKVPTTGTKVVFEIAGLSDPAEPTASFTVAFTLAQALPPTLRPAPAAITYAKATRADQAAINAQRVCKVSGESLGSMGTPIKVTRGDRSVFLCCQGCLKTVQANPDRFFGKPTAAKDSQVN